MKKIVILIGCALGLPAYAGITTTLEQDVKNIWCTDPNPNPTTECNVKGSNNTVNVDSDYYNVIIGGVIPYDVNGDTIDVVNNKVVVNKSNDSRIIGSSVDATTNDNYNVTGSVDVNSATYGDVTGALLRSNIGYISSDISETNILLEGVVNVVSNIDEAAGEFQESTEGELVGSELEYTDAEKNIDVNANFTQTGTVNINDSDLGNTKGIVGTKTTFSRNVVDMGVKDITGHGLKDFNILGNVNLTNTSRTLKTNSISGVSLNGALPIYTDLNIAAVGNVNIKGGTLTDNGIYGINGALVDLNTDVSVSIDPITNEPVAVYDHKVDVTGNVNIDGTVLNGNVYGVHVIDNNADINQSYSGNVSVIGDGIADGSDVSIYGVFVENNLNHTVDYISNSTFTLSGAPITVNTIANFGNYKFALNNNTLNLINSSDSLLTITKRLGNDALTDSDGKVVKPKATIALTGINGDINVKDGSTVNLITIDKNAIIDYQVPSKDTEYSSLSEFFDLKDTEATIGVGLVRKADVSYDVVDDKTVQATIKNVEVDDEKVDDVLKGLGEGNVAALNNVLRGADNLAGVISDEHKKAGMFTPIAVVNGGKNKYKDSVHVNTTDYRFMVGSRYQFTDNLFAGIVLERGQSNYSANEGDISGSGHTYNYGVSLFSKYSQFFDKDEAYVEGAVGYGRTSTLYRSDNLITGGGVNAQYKSKANYLNGQLAVGYVYNLNNYGFDSSVRYLYTHLNKDGVVIEGDGVNFNSANSSRIQLKEKANFYHSNDITFSLAGIYEYEIDGKLDGSIDGVSAKSQSLKGSTGAMELGIKAIPTSDENFSVDLLLTGYSGKRKGVSGTFVAKYDF